MMIPLLSGSFVDFAVAIVGIRYLFLRSFSLCFSATFLNQKGIYFNQLPVEWVLVGQGHYEVPNSSTLKIQIPPILPFPVNFVGAIAFPAPKLVYTDIYMVGVPYYCFKLLSINRGASCCE